MRRLLGAQRGKHPDADQIAGVVAATYRDRRELLRGRAGVSLRSTSS